MTFTCKNNIFVRKLSNMDKKLTLSLNQKIIEKAKSYAKTNSTSLSKLIENYLNSLTISNLGDDKIESTPLVESLCGVIELPEDFDYKAERAKYLLEKYK